MQSHMASFFSPPSMWYSTSNACRQWESSSPISGIKKGSDWIHIPETQCTYAYMYLYNCISPVDSATCVNELGLKTALISDSRAAWLWDAVSICVTCQMGDRLARPNHAITTGDQTMSMSFRVQSMNAVIELAQQQWLMSSFLLQLKLRSVRHHCNQCMSKSINIARDFDHQTWLCKLLCIQLTQGLPKSQGERLSGPHTHFGTHANWKFPKTNLPQLMKELWNSSFESGPSR